VSTGFGGKISIDSDSREAARQAELEFSIVSHRGMKARMVFWARGCTTEDGLRMSSGLGIVGKTCPDQDQWVRDAYLITYAVDLQIAEILAVAMALKIAKSECHKLSEIERPSKVVIFSSAKDALLGIQEPTHVMLSGVRMPKAAVRVVEAGLVAAYLLRKLEVEVELQWFPDGCETEGALESNRAACEGAKYTRPLKGPDAFIMDVQAENKRKKKLRLRMMEAKERKQVTDRLRRLTFEESIVKVCTV
jgi:hypothetical protein